MKLLKKLLNDQKQITAIIIAAIFIFIMLIFIFVEAEISNNRHLTISNFEAMQQEIANQAAISMKSEYVNSKLDSNNLIEKTIDGLITSGSSYWFVAQDQKLLFVKDEISTKLYANADFNGFLIKSKAKGMEIVSSSFRADNKQYTIGNCTKVSYIEDNGQLFRHHIYIIMSFTLIGLFFFVLFIIGITKINDQKNRITRLNLQLKNGNILIEELTTKLKMYEQDKNSLKIKKDCVIYSKEVFASLLDKINKEKVIPLVIAVLEFKSNRNDIDSKEFKNVLKSVSEVLDTEEYVLAEIKSDAFVILIFNKSSNEKKTIQETLITKWAEPLDKHGIKVRIGISFVEESNSDVKDIYETICKEVYKQK